MSGEGIEPRLWVAATEKQQNLGFLCSLRPSSRICPGGQVDGSNGVGGIRVDVLRLRTRAERGYQSHLGDTGVRGYDLPTVIKLLEVHGGVPNDLLLGASQIATCSAPGLSLADRRTGRESTQFD